jgi:DNA polymerase-1
VSTPAKPTGGPGSVFLIDGSNFMFRAFHGLPSLTSPTGIPVNALHGFVRMISALRKEFAPDVLAVIFDHGGSSFRSALFPAYKAQRPPAPEDLIPQIPLVRQATVALGLPSIELAGVEADDIIATYAVMAQKAGRRVIIVSSDKDLMQLVDLGDADRPAILCYDTMKGKVIGPEAVQEKWGVGPQQLGDLLALTGDSSDNIPGVPGIGPKTAATLLAEFGDLEGLLRGASTIKQAKRREVLEANVEMARLSRRLVELDREVAGLPPLDSLHDRGADPDTVEAFFGPLGFKSVSGRVRAAAAAAGRGPRGRSSCARRAADPRPQRLQAVSRRRRGRAAGVGRRGAGGQGDGAGAAGHRRRRGRDPGAAGRAGLRAARAGAAAAGLHPGRSHGGLAAVGAAARFARALELLRPLFAGALPIWAHAAKFQAIVLRRCVGIEMRAAGSAIPSCASYTLDPARTDPHASPSWPRTCSRTTVMTQRGGARQGQEGAALRGRRARPQAGAYACERAVLTGLVGRHLRVQLDASGPAIRALHDQLELPLSRVLEKIEERGIRVDPAVLAAQSKALGAEIDKLRAEIEAEAGHPINPDSPLQLQKFLFEERGLEATRKTKTGFSTDAAVLEELAMLDPIVGPILEYRTLTKLKGTYLDTLAAGRQPAHGSPAHQLSPGGGADRAAVEQGPQPAEHPDPHPRGRPADPRGVRRRPPGRVLVALDYSQIELRILAHLSGDPELPLGVPRRRRRPPPHRRRGLRGARGRGHRRAAADRQGGQLRRDLRADRVRPVALAGHPARQGRQLHQGVLREDPRRHPLHGRAGRHRRGSAASRRPSSGVKRRIPELGAQGRARSYGERIARNTPIQGSAADIMKRGHDRRRERR